MRLRKEKMIQLQHERRQKMVEERRKINEVINQDNEHIDSYNNNGYSEVKGTKENQEELKGIEVKSNDQKVNFHNGIESDEEMTFDSTKMTNANRKEKQ